MIPCACGRGRQKIDVGSSSARSLSIGDGGQPLLYGHVMATDWPDPWQVVREGRTRRRGMIGSGSVVAGLRVFSDPRRWIGPVAVVCVLAIAAVAAAPAA